MSYLNLPNRKLFWTHEKHEDSIWHSKEESRQWQINWKIQKRKLFEVDITVVWTADKIVSNATI